MEIKILKFANKTIMTVECKQNILLKVIFSIRPIENYFFHFRLAVFLPQHINNCLWGQAENIQFTTQIVSRWGYQSTGISHFCALTSDTTFSIHLCQQLLKQIFYYVNSATLSTTLYLYVKYEINLLFEYPILQNKIFCPHQ